MVSGLTVLVVDNKSRYLWNLINYIRSKGNVVVRVDPFKFDLKKLKTEKIDGVILSGARSASSDKKRFNFRVIRLFRNKPILGICYGHKVLVEAYGGGAYKLTEKRTGSSFIHILKDNELIFDTKRIVVRKRHTSAAGVLPDCIEQLAYSTDCENEMIKHKKYPHFGVQFHPENGKDGRLILDNFLTLCKRMKNN